MDLADLVAARRRIQAHVRRTPLHIVEPGDPWLPSGGCLKLEVLQHTGTFKPRGAFNRILGARERGELDPEVGIVVASGGNAGLANAFAAAAVGVPATVFVPSTASPAKLRRLHTYGALVEVRGREYADAYDAAMEHVGRTGAVYCHAYDQPEICAGAGTLGARRIGSIAWRVATRAGVGSVLVDDDAILAARQATWDRYRVVIEAGAAAPVAALLSGAYRPADGERVAVVLCGANTDPSDLT